MRAMIRTLGTLALLAASTAGAAEPAKLCNNALDEDRQPEFSTTSLEMSNPTMKITANKELQLNTALKVFDPENIRLPFDQNISISYVFESAGASHTLGYMYMDELKARGYVDDNGNLLDNNNNGILDLHEDIYNLAPNSGTTKRPYVGGTRRCPTQLKLKDDTTFSLPDLASDASCGNTFNDNAELPDMRPPGDDRKIRTGLVGSFPSKDVGDTADDYSDNGLYRHVPNLLEPKHPDNNNEGLGRLVFLSGDDDSDTSNWRNLAPVKDSNNLGEGTPDYDVSAYTAEGIKRSSNPDKGISLKDRTVDLGPILGDRELVFFLVVYYEPSHSTTNGTVYPCMKMDAAGKCLLHLKTPISVFFSKSAWNMDQNMKGSDVVAARNIGCPYVEGAGCRPEDPANSPGACTVKNSTEKLCGWLDGPDPKYPDATDNTLYRLEHDQLYGNLKMPMEKVVVPRPPGGRNAMPHVIVGAPSTDPFRWILGFEDLNGGGDRDFNDIVFVINKENGGNTRSASVSGDITPDIAEDFTITKVRFTRQDDIAPAPRTCTNGPPCWSEEQANSCSPPGGPEATIRYSIAVDCNICANGKCTRNPLPTWLPVEFPNTKPPTQTVELDLLSLGVTGSQLCWKVDVSSPNERCHPIIDNINVGFQAVRSGSFARASPSAIGNALVWGVNETPGSNWGKNWPGDGLPEAATRAYDARKDYTLRGRLYFKSLYDPEKPDVTHSVQRWEAGRVMAESFRGSTDPLTRKLYTVTSTTNFTRQELTKLNPVETKKSSNGKDSPLFPDSLCDIKIGSVTPWDLNGDGKCATTSADKDSGHRVDGNEQSDRAFLLNWLYGWEDDQEPAPTGVKKPWALGGINLSTVALAIPPYKDTWYQNTTAAEQKLFSDNFIDKLKERKTVAYVGTMTGMLHAFESGTYLTSTSDTCAGVQYRGYFKPTGTSCDKPFASRDYGTGEELFAYLPYGLLERYRNQYAVFQGSGTLARPSMDASPSITNVDFGNLSPAKPAWTLSSADPKKGAKTVLVSASGKTSPVVFALDITRDPAVADATKYPIPLWEFDMLNTKVGSKTVSDAFTNAKVTLPDTKGSRFAPTVGRIMWGSDATKPQWAAIVGTDYEPGPDFAGALYLIDLKTGLPLKNGSEDFAGVITLDKGAGIGAESAMVDLDKDGTFDVIYVPTTAGHVYRINLTKVSTGKPLGSAVQKCLVADAPTSLDKAAYNPAGPGHQDQKYQQIFSNLGVTSTNTPSGPVVRFFFGTSDNPDVYSDGPPNKDTAYHYYLLGYEDTDPWGKTGCKPTLEPMWADALDNGQTVWGGVTLSSEQVFATTAVGKAADICNLSETQNGKFYATSQLNQTGVPHAATGVDLGGHGISAPIIHDEHIIAIDALGNAVGMGATGAKWNNKTGGAGNGSSRTLLWEKMSDGKLPKP